MKVRYSSRATRDLASIYQYLNDRSPSGAVNVLRAIYAAIEFIKRRPLGAPETKIPGVHGKTVRKYRFKVFYRVVEDDTLEIVHIRHMSRETWLGT
jgi:toxin ParE1/3/4